ncbi:hypothetical protein LX32DRAFT_115577 [Colletotrichum zoysiae]|uniref:Uncharacterized protein n=1 Tax=Colletotrichum zoysiae TaxID=1216348 RepID=A0AAD9LX65_9PEZI|nr:hypothetical protein LX32DRAFT_115577 [Colletotrichum zoysiae]
MHDATNGLRHADTYRRPAKQRFTRSRFRRRAQRPCAGVWTLGVGRPAFTQPALFCSLTLSLSCSRNDSSRLGAPKALSVDSRRSTSVCVRHSASRWVRGIQRWLLSTCIRYPKLEPRTPCRMPSSIITHDPSIHPSIHPSSSSARRHTVGVCTVAAATNFVQLPRMAAHVSKQAGFPRPSTSPSCRVPSRRRRRGGPPFPRPLSSSRSKIRDAIRDLPARSAFERCPVRAGAESLLPCFRLLTRAMFQYLRTVLRAGGEEDLQGL